MTKRLSGRVALVTGAARGINRGLVYRQDGTLIASVMQEGLLRLVPPAA